MRNLWLLTRFLLKTGPGNSDQKNSKKKKRSFAIGRAALYILLAVCFIPIVIAMFIIGKEGYGLFGGIGLSGIFVELICIIGVFSIFLFGIAMFISVFYLSSDVVRLLPLPFTPSQIVGAKWICCLINEYYLVGLLFLPILAGFGFAGRFGAVYWINLIVGCLVLPVIPLVYAAVLSMIVMRLFKNIRNKDLLTYLGFGASMIFAIGINVVSQGFSSMEAKDIMNLVQGNQGLLDTFRMIFPTLSYLAKSLYQPSLLPMGIYILSCAVCMVLFFLIAWKLYLPAVLGMSESTGEKRKMTGAEVRREIRMHKPAVSYAWIEWKKLYRTPVYFMNCVLMALIGPVFLLVVAAVSAVGSIGTAAFMQMIAGFAGQYRMELFTLLSGDFPVAIAVLVAGGMVAFLSMMCMVSSTALSRQGSSYILMKCIPLSYQEQIKGMMASGIVVSLVGTLPCLLLINFVAVIFGLHPVTLVYTAVISVLYILFANYEQMLVDLLHPKLNWDNESQAVKQNYMAVVSMFLELIVGGILIGIGVWLYVVPKVNVHIITVMMLAILAIGTWLMRRTLFTVGVRALERLE